MNNNFEHESADEDSDAQYGHSSAEETSGEESVDEAPAEELSDIEPLVVERPRAGMLPADNANGAYQRSIPIRWGISGNSTRGSRNLPDPKHLTIVLPDPVSRFFAGVWVAVQGDEVFFDFFARNGQNDRSGHAPSDPWRWIKIKDSGEIAMALNRPYTKSRSDAVLVRDYKRGAFKLSVPLVSDAGLAGGA